MKLLTKEELIDSIAKQVKHYEKEPMYYLPINQLNCIYEVFVNDMLIYGDFSLAQYASTSEINRAILKNSPQTLIYRLYPIGNLIKNIWPR